MRYLFTNKINHPRIFRALVIVVITLISFTLIGSLFIKLMKGHFSLGDKIVLIYPVSISSSLMVFFLLIKNVGKNHFTFSFEKKTLNYIQLIYWLFITTIFILLLILLQYYYPQSDLHKWEIALFKNAHYLFFMSIIIIFLGPCYEEILFRGFLFYELTESHLSSWTVIIITAATWSFFHIQYPLLIKLLVFISGGIFGLARKNSGNIIIPLILHIYFNAWQLAEYYFIK